MSRLTIELYDLEAEVVTFREDSSELLEIVFTDPCDGFVTAGGITSRVKDGRCVFDLRLMDDGETEPVLILREGRFKLPPINKQSGSIALAHPGLDYIVRLSQKERMLSKRVEELEKRIEELSKSITGVSIF